MHESRNVRRQKVARQLLAERDLGGLETWAGKERLATQALVSLTFDPEALVRWRAIEALGPAAARVYARSPEQVRRLLRRLLWLMNDESGGLCRHGPEAIGEILRVVPALAPEFGPLLPSFFVEEPFEVGSRLAVARVAPVNRQPFRRAVEPLVASLDDADAGIRASSALALRALGEARALAIHTHLRADPATVELYDFETGEFATLTVAALLERCLGSRP